MVNNQINLKKKIWLLGLCLEYSEDIDFYFIFFEDDRDYPLTFKSKLILFEKDALGYFFKNNCNICKIPNELNQHVDLVISLPQVSTLLERFEDDLDSQVLNTFNILFDITNYLKIELLEEERVLLYSIADHLTFTTSFFDLKKKGIEIKKVLSAYYSLIGRVISKSVYIKDNDKNVLRSLSSFDLVNPFVPAP